MFFDFFSIKIRGESKAADEIYLGYIFGKSREKLEYRFICIPRRYSRQLQVDLQLPLPNFKQFLSQQFQEMIVRSSDISEMTSEFMRYMDIQIRKMGGRDALSLRFSKVIETGDFDVAKMEISNLFQNWTSSLDLEISIDTSTYEELTSSFLGEVDVGDFVSSISARNDLMSIPEVYPIVDPLDGVSIDAFDIGDAIFCTVLGFNSEEEQKKLVEEFPEHFDAQNNNTIPLEGVIISKEILPSVSRNFVLIKVQVGSSFQAKSIVLRSIRLMYDPTKMRKRLKDLKNEADDESISLSEAMRKHRAATSRKLETPMSAKGEGAKDFFLTFFLVLLSVGLILIILYFFFFS
ncbi:MAG TPA: DUF4899 domain-containing protein [Thermotogota bacterium]|nr:DUF4899 domain-containing protein [Thermotogota bacterium]HRW91636.1 DUF4899 domain-containing protein [Thermotogota bacterium]